MVVIRDDAGLPVGSTGLVVSLVADSAWVIPDSVSGGVLEVVLSLEGLAELPNAPHKRGDRVAMNAWGHAPDRLQAAAQKLWGRTGKVYEVSGGNGLRFSRVDWDHLVSRDLTWWPMPCLGVLPRDRRQGGGAGSPDRGAG